MKLAIATTVLEEIVAHAAAALPDEACGLLLGDDGVITAAVPAANVAVEPATAFEIDPVTLLAVHRAARSERRAVAGCYHSHPNGRAEPSPADAARVVEDGWLWLVAARGDVTAWRTSPRGALHDRFDPVELVPA